MEFDYKRIMEFARKVLEIPSPSGYTNNVVNFLLDESSDKLLAYLKEKNNEGMTILLVAEHFEDASTIADHLNAKRTVVLNLESASKEISRRLIDFLSGVAYANEGQIKKVANCTYIITPYNVGIMGEDFLDELSNSGLY